MRCAGGRMETDDAGCLRCRATSPYGNVRCRGTVGGKSSRTVLWGDWSSNRRSYPDTREDVPEKRLPALYGVLPDLTTMTETPSNWLRTSAFTEALRQTLEGLAFLPSHTAEGLRFIT